MKMKLIIGFTVILALGTVGQAMPPLETPMEAMVTNNNLIVVGTLTNVTMISTNGFDYSSGSILVHEVLKGPSSTVPVRLSWRDISGMLCPRDPHPAHANSQFIWFLHTTNGVDATAEYHGAQKLDRKSEVLKLLNKKE